jgi:hypothetical protein
MKKCTIMTKTEKGKKFFCHTGLCDYFGRASIFNTRAYCKLYKKYLTGSAIFSDGVKVCADCAKSQDTKKD